MNPQDWKDVGGVGLVGIIVVSFILLLARKLDTLITAITEMRIEMQQITDEQKRVSDSLHSFRNRLIVWLNLPKGDKDGNS